MAFFPLKMRGCSALACAMVSTRSRTYPWQIWLFLVSLSLTGMCWSDYYIFNDNSSQEGLLERCFPRCLVALTIFYDRYVCHGKFIDAGLADTCYTTAESPKLLIPSNLLLSGIA